MSAPPIAKGAVSSISQIAITVGQLDRAVEFYRDVLGLPFLFEAGRMAFLDCGGVRLMLTLAEGAGVSNSIVYYKTDDIRAGTELLRAREVRFESGPKMIARMPDHELWMAFFRDSEGNLAALMSEVR